ncbi:hypothetical protein ACIOBK_33885 [Micromonospora chokoriensis]
MTNSESSAPGDDTTAQLAAVGISVTLEGKERARRLLSAAAARRTPELTATWRQQLGLGPQRAA